MVVIVVAVSVVAVVAVLRCCCRISYGVLATMVAVEMQGRRIWPRYIISKEFGPLTVGSGTVNTRHQQLL